MKKIALFFASAIFAGLGLTSCTSDDDSQNDGSSIIGKWNFSTEKYFVNGTLIYDSPYPENETGCSPDYLSFSDNGSLAQGEYSGSDCFLEEYTDTYVRSGNTITVTDDGDAATIEIISVSAAQLVLKNTYIYEGDTEVSVVTFTKA